MATGAIIGTTIKQISIKSKKKPSRKISSMLSKRNVHLPPGNWSKSSNISSSPPMPTKTRPKAVAPIKIKKTMLVKRVVCCIAWFRLPNVNLPCMSASSIAPKAPTAADSVGDAIPKKMEPKTVRINASGGNKLLITCMARCRCSLGSSLIAGAISGCCQATKAI